MRKLSITSIALGLVLLSGCSLQKMMKMAKDQELTVDPNPLEVHADSVNFEISAALPVKMLKDDHTYSLMVSYDYAGNEKQLEEIAFKGNDFPNSDTQQPRITKEYSFAYEPEMNPGTLNLQGQGTNDKNNKTKGPTEKLPVAEGLITTSTLVTPTSYAAVVSYDYEDESVDGWTPEDELEPTNIDFYFLQGSSVLRNSEKRSDRGEFFKAFVAEKNVTRTVTITGTHSPEGPERINSDLSENRAKVIEEWYRNMMDKYDYKGTADSIKFVLKPVIEDWSDFKVKLKDYDGIDQEAKNKVLNIVNGGGTFEDKEDELQELPSYDKIFDDVYPDLRSARTEILTVIEKKSDSEISVLAKQITDGEVPADTLSYGELAYAAHLTPSLEEKQAIYEATVKTYDNWAAHNNLGAVYLSLAASEEGTMASEYIEKAITQFEISAKKKDNAYAKGNIGVAEYQRGNTAKGYDAISEAIQGSLPSEDVYGFNGVKGALEIKQAEYKQAVKSLSNANDNVDNTFNKGLAQVLDGDAQNASITFDELADKENDYALGHYVAAIAAARLSKTEDAIDHLSKAVSSDPSLKEKANEDLEFKKIKSSEAFKNALK